MCPCCEGFGHEPEVFRYMVIPGKWQLCEHESAARYASCVPDIRGYGRPAVWMICSCVVNPALFRQVCAETALVSLANISGISRHPGSPVGACNCPACAPEAGSGATESMVREQQQAPWEYGHRRIPGWKHSWWLGNYWWLKESPWGPGRTPSGA